MSTKSQPHRRGTVTAENKAEAEKLRALWDATAEDRAARGVGSQAAFGLAYEIGNQPAVGFFLNGRTALSMKAARGFATGMNCSIADFSPRLAALAMATAEAVQPPSEEGDFALIKRADVRVSAGHGLLVFDEGSQSSLSFRRDFLRALGISPQNAVLVDVQGRSMEPTIPDGAVLLLNRADRDASRGRVYAVRHDGELLVKRMHKTATGYLAVSDNPDRNEYPDRAIIDDNGDFEIIGRAVWMGASL